MAADEFRTEAAALAVRLDDARGCVHVTAAGVMIDHHASMAKGDVCIEAPDFAAALDELRYVVAETAERIDALTDAAEQLHRTAHGADRSLLLCPYTPCAGLRRFLPNAHGVVPA